MIFIMQALVCLKSVKTIRLTLNFVKILKTIFEDWLDSVEEKCGSKQLSLHRKRMI